MANALKTWALSIGVVAALVGIWGFFQSPILGLFSVNVLQSVVHLIVGALGIYVGMKGDGDVFAQSLGYGSLALGVLGYVPVVDDLLVKLFAINPAISVLHIAVGVISLGIFFGMKNK